MRDTSQVLEPSTRDAVALAEFPEEIRDVLSGIPGAADRLWGSQVPRLLRAALALGLPPAEAPDVVQESMLAAFRALHRFRPDKGSFEAWTHAILLRRCANWRRARGRFLRAVASLGRDSRPRPAAPDQQLDARRMLERMLEGLSATQRRIWTLMEISGLGTEEVARMLRIREATVRSHLRHARASLRRRGEEMR